MGIQRYFGLFILALGLMFFSACGSDGPAGNGQITIGIPIGTNDDHLPIIAGDHVHFTNLAVSPSHQLTFSFSIDANGISSLEGFNYAGAELVLRVVQASNSSDTALLINSSLGVNLTGAQLQNFDQHSPASFQILYNGIERLHGQIHY